jgi:hypothetical protein
MVSDFFAERFLVKKLALAVLRSIRKLEGIFVFGGLEI